MKHVIILLVLCCICLLCWPTLLCARPRIPHFKQVENAWEAFGPVVAERCGVHHLLTGGGAMVDEKHVMWTYAFTSNRALTIKEARPLALHIADEIWKYAECNEQSFTEYHKKPMTRSRFGYKLAFWDPQVNRPLSPYLAQINLVGDQLLYFYADPVTQALLPPVKETLDEAQGV